MQHKHFSQMSSLASLLLPAVSEKSQCSDPHLILELGAGRAYTSLYLAHVLRLRAIPTHVLAIDRATNRLKADRTLRQWASDPATSILSFKRLRLDIQHLHIAGIADIASCHKVVVVGKHVCGVALDLSLVAVTKFAREWRNGEGCITVALACCCRRLCCWGAFCGAGEKEGEEGKEGKEEESLCKRWGVSELDFGQLCRSANWGLDEGHSEEMKEMGEASREVVDSLRVLWMRRNGWHANVVVYTDASPENVCIVARWCGNSN